MTDELKYHYKYPHPSVTTDCVLFGFDGERLNVLLIQRANPPCQGQWAFPGGFLEMDEDAETGARRELQEETRLQLPHIRQFAAFSNPDRDPRERIITIAHYAIVPMLEAHADDDAANAQWFALDNIPPLAFDHDEVLSQALTALRRTIHFEAIGTEVMPDTFAIADLQKLYEAIEGRKAENFADRIMSSGMLSPSDKEGEYTFNTARCNELRSNNTKVIY